jgi:biopolymer transport protein ExbD
MTSLIDVIFLLLLFFMLSSTFARHGELPFAAGGAGVPAPRDRPPVFLRLGVEGLTVNGEEAEIAQLAESVTAHTGGKETQVIVALAGPVTSQDLVDVLAVLRRMPDIHVAVVD